MHTTSLSIICTLLLHTCYCTTCAEKKLAKLEGTNKAKLTSKDVLTSLSEACEDHMRQLLSNTEATSTSLSRNNLSADLCEPWKIHSTTAANVPHKEHEDIIHIENHIEIAQQQCPRNWRWLCCTCCSSQRVTYSRAVQRTSTVEQPLTSLTPEEESAFLLDCDELALTWGNDREKR